MKRMLAPLASVGAVLLVSTLPAMVQTAPAPPLASLAPAALGIAGQPTAEIPSAALERFIDRPVKKVDPIVETE